MPFNVNPPCPIDLKTRVTWQFQEKSEQTNDSGDDYLVNSVPPEGIGMDVGILFDCEITNEMYEKTPDTATYYPQRYGVRLENVKSFSPGNSAKWFKSVPWGGYSSWCNEFTFTYEQYTSQDRSSFREVIAYAPVGYFVYKRNSVRNVEIQAGSHTSPAFRVTPWQEVQILKNGVPVFSQSGSNLLSITHKCGVSKCPPNTCEVSCGDTICCYNSEGISVFNYLDA